MGCLFARHLALLALVADVLAIFEIAPHTRGRVALQSP